MLVAAFSSILLASLASVVKADCLAKHDVDAELATSWMVVGALKNEKLWNLQFNLHEKGKDPVRCNFFEPCHQYVHGDVVRCVDSRYHFHVVGEKLSKKPDEDGKHSGGLILGLYYDTGESLEYMGKFNWETKCSESSTNNGIVQCNEPQGEELALDEDPLFGQ